MSSFSLTDVGDNTRMPDTIKYEILTGTDCGRLAELDTGSLLLVLLSFPNSLFRLLGSELLRIGIIDTHDLTICPPLCASATL